MGIAAADSGRAHTSSMRAFCRLTPLDLLGDFLDGLIQWKTAPGHCEGVMEKEGFVQERMVKILRGSRRR